MRYATALPPTRTAESTSPIYLRFWIKSVLFTPTMTAASHSECAAAPAHQRNHTTVTPSPPSPGSPGRIRAT
jgi:hypothetical protein